MHGGTRQPTEEAAQARPVHRVCVDVLGPVRLTVDGAEVDLGGPLPRRLLAVLAAAAGRAVPVDLLVEELWGADPPGRPLASLQAYVSGLRRALGPARDALVRAGEGYALRLPPGALDAARFAEGVAAARRDAAAGLPGRARDLLEEALACWRGRPFADADPAFASAESARLGEVHAAAVEDLLEARLAAGEDAAVAADAEAAIEEAPLRERRWGLRALALYRDGRQADALACLRALRRLLADEVGVDPGPQVQQLEARLLAQDPALLAGPAPRAQGPGPDPGGPPAQVPPPQVPDPRAPALPPLVARLPGRPLTTFVGRGRERARLESWASRRLVTLVGPGGAGKTRLALEHVSGLTRSPGAAPVRWVRCADVREPGLLPVALAAALGVASSGDDPVAAVETALGVEPALLVLDNCEHLVAAVAEVVTRLLETCADLQVLATSREALGVDGECVLPLGPLPVDPRDAGDRDAARPALPDAVRLLLDRVAQVRPGWTPGDADLAAAADLARALDGIPLALELAAARARVLSLPELAQRVGDRFALLDAAPLSGLSRHRSLLAAVTWSTDLASADERRLLARLWPFEGGFGLGAAEAVAPGGVPALPALAGLVSRSLVQADTGASPTRYSLLETLRDFGRRTCEAPREAASAHAAWAAGLAARAAGELRGPRAGETLLALERELPNVRAALSHDLAADPPRALRTVAGLCWFWYRRGYVREGLTWTARAIEAAPDADASDRFGALLTMADLFYVGGSHAEGGPYIDEVERGLEDPALRAALPVGLRGLALAHAGYFRLLAGEPAEAVGRADAAAAMAADRGLPWLACEADMVGGAGVALAGDVDGGLRRLLVSVEVGEGCGHRWGAASSAWIAGGLLVALRRPAEAMELLRRSIGLLVAEHDRTSVLAGTMTTAAARAMAGDVDGGGRLLAACRAHGERVGYSAERMDPRTGAAAAALTAGASEEAVARGRALTWEEMIDLALEEVPG